MNPNQHLADEIMSLYDEKIKETNLNGDMMHWHIRILVEAIVAGQGIARTKNP